MTGDEHDALERDGALRRVLQTVASLNLGYFMVEFLVALVIGSVALLADSIDFLEDASLNILILVAFAWGPRERARVGMVLAAIILLPSLGTLWAAFGKLALPVAPAAAALSLAGLGALLVNGCCALLLAGVRGSGGSLTLAVFLSARNDVVANVAIILAGLATAATLSLWPDLLVGIGIFAMNARAAFEVFVAARAERIAGRAQP